jgi:hypothetical protein
MTDKMTDEVSVMTRSLRVRDVMAAELMPTAVDRVRAQSLTLWRMNYSAGAQLCGKTLD